MDMTHLTALETRLSHERNYLARAKTKGEQDLRRVWISQVEREIEREKTLLGIAGPVECDLSDDELLAALSA